MIRNVSHHPLAMRLALSLQHLLAVFAGTVFVPIVLGLSIPLALLFSGVSTLMFHYFTSGKIPFYYGSSFTILAGMTFIHHQAVSRGMTDVLADCYVCLGSLFIGVIYLLVGPAPDGAAGEGHQTLSLDVGSAADYGHWHRHAFLLHLFHPHRLADGHRHGSGCGLGATVLQGKGEIVFHFYWYGGRTGIVSR